MFTTEEYKELHAIRSEFMEELYNMLELKLQEQFVLLGCDLVCTDKVKSLYVTAERQGFCMVRGFRNRNVRDSKKYQYDLPNCFELIIADIAEFLNVISVSNIQQRHHD